MQRFRNILVGIDLSNVDRLADVELTPPNQQALKRAIWLASHTKGALTIFSALDVSSHAQAALKAEIDHVQGEVEDTASEVLERFVTEAKYEGALDVSAKLTFGTPWLEIARQAVAGKHDLVIVGTRDLGRAGRILFGSTAIKLLRNCPVPVWVTRPDPNWDDLNILVPSDLSDVSLEALRIAVDGGQLVDTRLHLLHAMEQIAPPAWFGPQQKQIVADRIEALRAEARTKLHAQLAATDYRTLKTGVQVHVVDGPPDEAILKAVDDFHIDLVVMGTSARSGISSFVIGNTAERLIFHLKCSVIAVKPPGFECPVDLAG